MYKQKLTKANTNLGRMKLYSYEKNIDMSWTSIADKHVRQGRGGLGVGGN